MGGRITFTIGGYDSRIGLRVLDDAGKMVSEDPYVAAQHAFFEELKGTAMIMAAKEAQAIQAREGGELKLGPYDRWHRWYMPVPNDMLPDRVSIKNGKTIDGFYSQNGLAFVCGRLKNMIEDFDPNIHQFKKLRAEYRDGSDYEADTLYAFRPLQMLDSVDSSHENFIHYGDEDDPLHALSFAGSEIFEVSAKVVGSAGIWHEQRLSDLCFSDAFMKRLRKEKIPGWQVVWGKPISFREV